MTSRIYRGRFAPSPTGPLHFGSLIAALGSFLDARAHGGSWMLRMEDIDRPRIVPGAADDILRTLEACSLTWDGAVIWQRTRSDACHAALHRLQQGGTLYACACSRREIADSAISGIEGYVYPGTCRAGSLTRPARALRVRTHTTSIIFDDAVQGRITQNLGHDVGDFVVYRADRIHAYQLAVVVDDAEQGITDVVRGADLLDSTPRQIHLQQLLGLPTPRYLHLPVAINAAGEKLSKQTRAQAVDRNNVQPALLSALRFLGQAPPAELTGATIPELLGWAVTHWDRARIPRRRALPLES